VIVRRRRSSLPKFYNHEERETHTQTDTDTDTDTELENSISFI
jgi:hypothetical protein